MIDIAGVAARGRRFDHGTVGASSVLIVGAGIAGTTLASLLGRAGMSVTVVERSNGQRSSGSPVDVRGPALAVVDRMNLLDQVRAAATRVSRLAAVDDQGRVIGWIPTQTGSNGIEIPRGDLAAILASAGREHAEFRYDDTVTAVHAHSVGVDVTFDRAPPARFDLVVGADGLHSAVRRMVFGPDDSFAIHLGMHIATLPLDRPAANPSTVLIHNRPGRAVVVHPATGREGAAFIFRHPRLPDEQSRDPISQKRLLTAKYGDMGWRVPELLDHLRDGNDLYFDAVTRIRLDRWSTGRAVLVGDAADCISLLGEGSSMAIAGAATLARHLTQQDLRLPDALHRYEHDHRRRLRPHHLGASAAGHLLTPATAAGVTARDMVFRVAATLDTTISRVRHHRTS